MCVCGFTGGSFNWVCTRACVDNGAETWSAVSSLQQFLPRKLSFLDLTSQQLSWVLVTYAFVFLFSFCPLFLKQRQNHAAFSFMPAANEGGLQSDSRQTERLSDGQTEACTNNTKREGGIDDFWGEKAATKKIRAKHWDDLRMWWQGLLSCYRESFDNTEDTFESCRCLFEVTNTGPIQGLGERGLGCKNKEMKDGLQFLSPPQKTTCVCSGKAKWSILRKHVMHGFILKSATLQSENTTLILDFQCSFTFCFATSDGV